MRKLVLSLALVMALLASLCSCAKANKRESITQQVLETLSQEEWARRTVGTEGNIKAGEYLADLLSELGYVPYSGDSLYVPFSQPIANSDSGRKTIDASNIIGCIRGLDSSRAWVLSAHFDGKSNETNGNATASYDNASGCAALADISARLAKRAASEPFVCDILICFFNGEEEMLSGSRAFADVISFDYEEIININIDCVGGIGCGALAFSPDATTSTLLHETVKALLDKEGIDYDTGAIPAGSDNYNFSLSGMSAIGLIQRDIEWICHSPNDVIENVSISELDKISTLVVRLVTENSNVSFISGQPSNNGALDWDAIEKEADRLTEGIELGYDDLFVFELDGVLYYKGGYCTLHSIEEISKYLPELRFETVLSLDFLKDYALDSLDVSNLNPTQYGYFFGDTEARGLIKNDIDPRYSKVINFASGDNLITLSFSDARVHSYYSYSVMEDDYSDYMELIDNDEIIGFAYENSKESMFINIEYRKRTAFESNGVSGYLVEPAINDIDQLRTVIDGFDIQANAKKLFEELMLR